MTATPEPTVAFEATPVQQQLMDLVSSGQYTIIGFGGGIRSTKTWGTLSVLIALCRIFPGSRWAVVRKDLERLRQTTLPSFEKLRVLAGNFIAPIHWEGGGPEARCSNGSVILFRGENIEKDPDLMRFHGYEVNGFDLEEADELAEKTLHKSIERAGAWIVPKGGAQPPPLIFCTFNPNVAWPRRVFYEPWRAGMLKPPFAFVPATIADNPHAPDTYKASLKLLPAAEYRRFVVGEWDGITGGLAFPAWNAKVHLAPHRTPPASHALVLGMDWGIAAPSVVVAVLVSPQKTLLAIREWTWTGKDAYEAGYDFGTNLMSADLPSWPEWFVADSAMNERTGVGGTTIMSEFQSGLNDALRAFRTPPLTVLGAPKGPGSRAAMFNQLTKVLAWGPMLENGTVPATRMPQFQIALTPQGEPTCPTLAQDLATAQRHEKKSDEVDKEKSPMHAGEALGYLLSLALPVVQVREPDIPQDRHPGWLPTGQMRSRDRSPEVVARERRVVAEYAASRRQQPPGDRYGRSPRRPS